MKRMETTALMTRAEIEAAYPDQWVALADVETDELTQVSQARVLCHNADYDLVYEALEAAQPRDGGVLFTGWDMPLPAGVGGYIL